MTRATLLRHLVALRMLSAGLEQAWFWLIPAKAKNYFAWERRIRCIFIGQTLEILARSIEKSGERLALLKMGGKIGDSLQIRKPYRFAR